MQPVEREVHISGVLVQVLPGRALAVSAAVAALPHTDVRAVGETGKLVVVCECASEAETLALMGRIRELPGVADVALVYQHTESASAMEEEICDENDPPGIH